jgi:hypothetical protein
MENSHIGDERLKTNLKVIENALDGISTIKGYEHGFVTEKIPDYRKHYGLIAQEIEKEFPHLVRNSVKLNKDFLIYKAIDHNQLIAVMVQAINQLNDKVNKLKEEINEFKNGN